MYSGHDMTRIKIGPLLQSILAGFVVFATVLVCVNYLSIQAKKINRQNLDHQLLIIAEHAAALIDGDQHEQLLATGETNSALYNEMIAPLVKLHNVTPEIYYLYTMRDSGTEMVFGLDTSTSSQLISDYELEPSFVGDIWEVDEAQYRKWSNDIQTKGAHVDEDFTSDEFGTFLTASAPFYNSAGRVAGFVGVDIGTTYFNAYQKRINDAVLIAAFLDGILSIIIAYFICRKQRDIQKLQHKLYQDAVTDPLTQCFNRRHFNDEYDKARKAFAQSGTNFSIAILDIDHFKQINDTHGHDAGDQILKQFANILKIRTRSHGQLFRIGGEEFVLLVNNADKHKTELAVAQCFAAIKDHVFIVNGKLQLDMTASVGVAEAQGEMDVLKAADEALYRAKDQGRDQIVVAA